MQPLVRGTEIEKDIRRLGNQPNVAAELLQQLAKDTFEAITRQGSCTCDIEELTAHMEAAKAFIRARAVPPFNTDGVADRQVMERIAAVSARAERLRSKYAVLEARLNSAREQTSTMPPPQKSHRWVIATGVGVFTLAFAPTVYSCFFAESGDAITGWVLAVCIGALIGAFLCLMSLRSESAEGPVHRKRAGNSGVFLGGLAGVGFLLLRLAKADGVDGYLTAVGLSVIESAGVWGLAHYSAKWQADDAGHRQSQVQISALEEAMETVRKAIESIDAEYKCLLDEVRQRETNVFDVEQLAAGAAFVVEANYRAAITNNQRLLEGGAPSAFPPLALSIHTGAA